MVFACRLIVGIASGCNINLFKVKPSLKKEKAGSDKKNPPRIEIRRGINQNQLLMRNSSTN
jgi:hypothetical protein